MKSHHTIGDLAGVQQFAGWRVLSSGGWVAERQGCRGRTSKRIGHRDEARAGRSFWMPTRGATWCANGFIGRTISTSGTLRTLSESRNDWSEWMRTGWNSTQNLPAGDQVSTSRACGRPLVEQSRWLDVETRRFCRNVLSFSSWWDKIRNGNTGGCRSQDLLHHET